MKITCMPVDSITPLCIHSNKLRARWNVNLVAEEARSELELMINLDANRERLCLPCLGVRDP